MTSFLLSVMFVLPTFAMALQSSLWFSRHRVPMTMSLTADNLLSLPVKEAINAVCGPVIDLVKKYMIPNTSVVKSAPTPCQYIIANPKAFLEQPKIAKLYGFDIEEIGGMSIPAEKLAKHLPVIYLADVHPEYGTLGFVLNKQSGKTMNDFHPELRSLRRAKVYLGGAQNKGSSFTMVHKKVGFPENRAWKGIPVPENTKNEFKLFYSPNVAMANELCLTKDATPLDFKFFQWSTIWLPNQLALEYNQKLWLTIQAPSSVIFQDDEEVIAPLWRRIVASLPEGLIRGSAGSSGSSGIASIGSGSSGSASSSDDTVEFVEED